MQITLRPGVEADLDWLQSELKAFADFHGSRLSLYGDPEYVRRYMLSHMRDHVLLVAETEHGQVGFIAGFITQHPFNPRIRVLTETFWWVNEEHRGSRAGLMLLNAFTDIGKDKADWIVFTLEHHSPVTDRCLLKRGYQLRERQYLLEVS